MLLLIQGMPLCGYSILSVAPFFVLGEADLVLHHVTSLVSSGVNAKDIAVIAPYNLQVSAERWGGEERRGRGGEGRGCRGLRSRKRLCYCCN